MTVPDFSALTHAELLTISKELDQQIEAKRSEELKVLVDGFAKKMEAAGFTVREAIEALMPYDRSAVRANKRASAGAKRVA